MRKYCSYRHAAKFGLIHTIGFFVWTCAWLAKVAMAQDLNGAISSSVSFLDAGLTTLGHIAAFANCFLRGRLDVEMASRDLLVSLGEEELVDVSGAGSGNVTALSTTDLIGSADVVLITTNISNLVMRSFMKHIKSCYSVDSLVLSCLPLHMVPVTTEECLCNVERCSCLCLWATPEIMYDLVQRLPGNIKQMSSELYLLPCQRCFTTGCHGCSHSMLYRDWTMQPSGLRYGDPDITVLGALCTMISSPLTFTYDKCRMCLAIPTFDAVDDRWSGLLLKIMSTKDEAERDLHMDSAEALDLYMRGQRSTMGSTKWSLGSFSFLVPRLVEMVLNFVLRGWFRVDGFSSALVSRRTVRDYIVNSIGNGLHAGAFLSNLDVSSLSTNVHICQRLQFRAPLQSLRAAALIGSCVNAISTIWWIVAVALHRGLGSWSNTYSRPPSLLKLYALLTGITLALAMDTAHAYLNRRHWKTFPLLWAAMGVQLLALLTLTSILGISGSAVFGTWIFGVIQVLAWIKWIVGSLLLTSNVIDQFPRAQSGTIVYSSAYLLTAILAASGGNWK